MPLTTEDFKAVQKKLGWTNEQTAKFFGKSAQTISNWKSDKTSQAIPPHVDKMLDNLVKKYGSLEEAGKQYEFTEERLNLF